MFAPVVRLSKLSQETSRNKILPRFRTPVPIFFVALFSTASVSLVLRLCSSMAA